MFADRTVSQYVFETPYAMWKVRHGGDGIYCDDKEDYKRRSSALLKNWYEETRV